MILNLHWCYGMPPGDKSLPSLTININFSWTTVYIGCKTCSVWSNYTQSLLFVLGCQLISLYVVFSCCFVSRYKLSTDPLSELSHLSWSRHIFSDQPPNWANGVCLRMLRIPSFALVIGYPCYSLFGPCCSLHNVGRLFHSFHLSTVGLICYLLGDA